ncbi:ABC-type transport system involved in multi-copper enzyme maturation, permease component [Thioflavicoccus mobilis 8321]|uniref:ABC-type transport system involved in multi-copper enzyme maturation, permease component n=1 Tax=Thioflavicoccus mobilis 8321 TaxID=765912 RepID=L0GYI6_9GAMM|nr:Gldg family protein [Thioflavicoccus mobilis]AGA91838.1 ABC-type transport system involved in multi-copper enzyme maturation, permease component [Thioflavicoccus mobilis 8321]
MSEILQIARKELAGYFGSPVAYIFIGAFLAATLFVFFWVETFFARNIADARPLFDWMPLLLIFLVAALTMRLWSEERRAGTLETLLTLPVSPLKLVLGKFLAAQALVTVAVALTLPLPITVALLGPLDWGPVLGAYLATLLLAASYIAIGVFISSRTDNPIVALIGTALVCGLFFLLGSHAITAFFGHQGAELLERLGSGSRFASISRGVLDLRDLYFYLSVVGVFLALTVYSLERLRWATDSRRADRHRRWGLVTALLIANFVAGNLWLQQLGWARVDLTQGQVYSVSQTTRNYLDQLQEPLLIRGYFSARTHPLLAPLVPQLRDLLREYQVAGGNRVRAEIVDPLEDPDLEREAGEKYGIRPIAFETADKYQTGVVNSYFDIVVQYGDRFEHLGFADLIEVKGRGEGQLDVRLRNPEYDLTRTIKKVLYGYRGGGDLFSGLAEPVTLHAYISPTEDLPEPLPGLVDDLKATLDELTQDSGGRFRYRFEDPDAGDGALAKEIGQRFGFRPLVLSLADPKPFWLSLALESGDQAIPVPLPEDTTQAGLKRAIEAGIRRFTPGYLKTLALYTPQGQAALPGMNAPSDFSVLETSLNQDFKVTRTDLSDGRVPSDADLLIVAQPEGFTDKQVFAVDQFLMQGGTVLMAASPYHIDLGSQSISAQREETGLADWLEQMGATLEPTLVLDPQNTPFPIPVQRDLGGFVIEEIRSLAYPYFPDIRGGGLADDGPTAGLGQITLNWASPIELADDTTGDRHIIELLKSSPRAWTSDSTQIQPDFDAYGQLGFPVGDETGRQLLGVAIEGRFHSAFAGQASPLLAAEPAADDETTDKDEKAGEAESPAFSGVVETSPASARLILIGSASFLTDAAMSLATQATQSVYTKPVELIQNAADWSLEDRGLLALRGHSQYSRLLEPLGHNGRLFWEYFNYALALIGLGLVYLVHRAARARRQRFYDLVLTGGRD